MHLSESCPKPAGSWVERDLPCSSQKFAAGADKDANVMETLITGDESMVYGCDP